MAERKTARKATQNSTQRSESFTKEERAAMRERTRELKAARKGADEVNDESTVLAKIAEMSGTDRAMAERIHAIVRAAAPELSPRTWYGMPAYANDGKVVCFFQPAEKFRARYSTLGFNDAAALDDGRMWPTSFALRELTAAEEKRIAELVRRAARRAPSLRSGISHQPSTEDHQ